VKDRGRSFHHHGYEKPQLFNLTEDPEEMQDRSDDPRAPPVRQRLLRRRARRLGPESMRKLSRSPRTSPSDFGESEGTRHAHDRLLGHAAQHERLPHQMTDWSMLK